MLAVAELFAGVHHDERVQSGDVEFAAFAGLRFGPDDVELLEIEEDRPAVVETPGRAHR